MPDPPSKMVDPLTTNPIKAESLRPTFETASESALAQRFPTWFDRETAKGVAERAGDALKRAEIYMNAKISTVSGKPPFEHSLGALRGKPAPAKVIMDAGQEFKAREHRIGRATHNILQKLEAGHYKPRIFSKAQTEHVELEKRAAAVKSARDAQSTFNVRSRGS